MKGKGAGGKEEDRKRRQDKDEAKGTSAFCEIVRRMQIKGEVLETQLGSPATLEEQPGEAHYVALSQSLPLQASVSSSANGEDWTGGH